MPEETNMTESGGGEELLTIEEATKFLDTSKSTLYRLISQGDIKGVKVGKQWRFRTADLTAYLERSPVAAAAAPRADLERELDFFAEELLAAGGSTGGVDVNPPEDASSEAKTIALAYRILLLAITVKASDIHLEPTGKTLQVRYRIDGVLQAIRQMPTSLHDSLLTRFKQMAEMNLSEKRVPQDGRIFIRYEEKDYDIRMSVLPTTNGENAVMRILDHSTLLLGLDMLGIEAQDLNALHQWIHKSSGMIIATGPTGAGKTTLLYACLQGVNTVEKKILTIEDPVEYPIGGIAQIQVNRRAGMTFAAALRSFLRQDPDIIMVGEMRDLETAQIAVEASLTGHLVFSTLHTEDAPAVLVRLADMGIERYLIAAILSGVIAVRLARRLCAHCKTAADAEKIESTLRRVRPLTQNGGYRIPDDAIFYSAVGCDQCRRTGYQGRIGLFEVLSCTPQLIELLLKCSSSEEMTRLAVTYGMKTLLADGIRKAIAGETTIDEVLRATATWL